MRWTYVLQMLVLALLLGVQEEVSAQMSGGGGGSSSTMFGNKTTGTGGSSSTVNVFGSNSALGSVIQSARSGSASLGNNFAGAQGQQPGSFIGANTGQGAGSQGFIGAAQANTTGGSRYGSGGSGMSGMGGMNGMGGMSGMGGMGGMSGMGGMNGRRQGGFGNGTNNNATASSPVRTTLTLGFDRAVAAAPEVNTAIAQHLGALPALHWQGPAQVEMQGRTAVLRGVVATEHDRGLAERVVRLEPTVDQVQNLIEVAGQTPATTVERIPAAKNSAAGSSPSPALGSPALLAPTGTASQGPAAPGAR